MTKACINELSHSVIGAAIEVHRVLGPGLLESAYESAFSQELTLRRIGFQRQKVMPLSYKGLRSRAVFASGEHAATIALFS